MCGLLGIAVQKGSGLSPDLAGYLLTRLMNSNEGRGGDSYGLGVVVPETSDVRMYKTVGRISSAGLSNKTWRKGIFAVMDTISAQKTVVALGHNRKATTGKNSERNAHPFLCGKPGREDFVIGAHNGIISPWQEIIKAWKLESCAMEVDSEVLFRGMQKFSAIEKSDIKVLSELIPLGMIASTYMQDLKTLSLYQGDNPLSLAIGDGFVIWSSLKIHLDDHTFGMNVKTQMVGTGTVAKLDLETFKITTHNVSPSNTLRNIIEPPTHGYGVPRSRGVFQGRTYFDSQRYAEGYRRTFGVDHEEIEEALESKHTHIIPFHPHNSYGYNQKGGTILDEIPSVSISSPRNKHDKSVCCCCKGYDSSGETVDDVEPWELLWHRGEELCTTCYYYMVQSAAEAELRRKVSS